MAGTTSGLALLLRAAAVLIGRPRLWPTALRQLAVLTPPGWWRRPPFFPLPDPDYLKFRLQTAYGGAGTAAITPGDLVAYLEWCHSMRVLQAGSGRLH